ncbi:hypothetical protein N7462_005662 [Penicillium macrosclerotiorum]|uniref:uncharacterized protein n=1 Tax=Penicillium macrosclerotiorum TaxID=303699 RepID=UPI002547A1D1|nr:uncharacterized protein N7462_005662 [Penicillium macrosclerotiorum]KAJ5682497.1 hypothetical protein N7462_005662 [Penicillium macrosclerotiorum]
MANEALRIENQKIVDDYLATPFWEDDGHVDRLFSSNCIWEFPYAPPGMPQAFSRPRRPVFAQWLRRTMREWTRSDVQYYPTLSPRRFWVESSTKAMVTWGDNFERAFECQHIELIEVTNGKISNLKTWSDPTAYYKAAGIILPSFQFNRPSVTPSEYVDTPFPNPPTKEPELSETKQRLFNWYLRPSSDNPSEMAEKAKTNILFDPNFRFVMPFMPTGLTHGGDRNLEATMIKWVDDTIVEWHQVILFYAEQ